MLSFLCKNFNKRLVLVIYNLALILVNIFFANPYFNQDKHRNDVGYIIMDEFNFNFSILYPVLLAIWRVIICVKAIRNFAKRQLSHRTGRRTSKDRSGFVYFCSTF